MGPTDQKKGPGVTENEGEGSRTAARRYNDAASAQTPERANAAAERARKALEGEEGEELRRAEEKAKNEASEIERDKEIPERDADVEGDGETADREQ